ncbi:thiamine diphosphokinase [Sporobolomyces salmoneus]|uniref:thiamine diphosphokinase n=1 Tax=Sporobolomyces salmoneus TaxID=183962 RepID=UPI003176A247
MSSEPTVWDTRSFLTSSSGHRETALIILNTPLPPQPLFERIWKTARVRYCADGGANRLFDRFVKGKGKSEDFQGGDEEWLPDLVLGDLDSLRPDVKEFYESKGIDVRHDPDEYSTDLGKNVNELSKYETSLSPDSSKPQQLQLVIIGGLSGRLDQTIHTLHALTQLVEKQGRDRVWAIGKESAACILPKGKHQLKIDLESFGKTCGILPLGTSQAHVTTTGLEWDLGPTSYMYPTSLAEAVSTSNHLIQEDVTIETDVTVVWTMEVRGGAD